jgi:hypothetical protein
MAATDAQRAAVAGRSCIICGAVKRVDPAHLIPRAMGGCGDAACVTARSVVRVTGHTTAASSTSSRTWSRDGGRSSRDAVGHVGLIGALRQISGRRTARHDQRAVRDADWQASAGGSVDDEMPTLVRDPQPAEFARVGASTRS